MAKTISMTTNKSCFDAFAPRHNGIDQNSMQKMLEDLEIESMEKLIYETIPDDIKLKKPLELPEAVTEFEWLQYARKIAGKNKVFKSFIGQGYYETITPAVILRNVFENPGWYTQYTPYQAEISQGRLEALLNFQTMVADLTGMELANASLLDESTAAAEAMALMHEIHNKKRKVSKADKLFVDNHVFRQTKDVLETRANALGITIMYGDWKAFEATDDLFGFIVQYPNSQGSVCEYRELQEKAAARNIPGTYIADLMSLTLLVPPGEWGADIVVGSTQRFGVPMGFGGPHAAYFASKDEYKRQFPGRIIGVSVDADGNPALRMALQTREQHIKREKATSNICTAQALLAIMAGMYGVYHGKSGLVNIAQKIHFLTQKLYSGLKSMGLNMVNDSFFDTLTVVLDAENVKKVNHLARQHEFNFFCNEDGMSINIGETICEAEIESIIHIFGEALGLVPAQSQPSVPNFNFSEKLNRRSDFLTHPVFEKYRSETALMRYIKYLENKDMSLVYSMIPLGSCTMKLNAAAEMIPVSWPEFANMHPFAPTDQTEGYQLIFKELEDLLCKITGFVACSFQPNSGAQGEYAGLMAIRRYHEHRNDLDRNVILIPSSAHGTNPASAVMAGMNVEIVICDDHGNISVEHLKEMLEKTKGRLAGVMITYPSTHGVFEKPIVDMCDLVHQYGGLVYMDGANMNAQIGITNPGTIGADVCHLNLHKTFAIPHGGGGPGVGPILVNDKLAPFLPGHWFFGKEGKTSSVSSAPWGSAGILMISLAYIRMMGGDGLTKATEIAILNANYLAKKLSGAYKILYTGELGRVAHEFILDLNPFKHTGITAEDVAKRLMDYGFHAPTVAFPVVGTLMIEPTESEDIRELDRFVEAFLTIREEIEEIVTGKADPVNNLLKNAPHTVQMVTSDSWDFPYTRERAAFPVPGLKTDKKAWPTVRRIDNAYGDRNLFCSCIPVEEYIR